MAEDGFKNTIIGMVLFVAFAWLILSVAVDTGAEYGRDSHEIGNGSLSDTSFETEANTVQSSASSYRTAFESGQVDDIDDASGMFGTAKKFITLITTPFTLIGQIAENVLGIPSLVIDVILGALVIALILGIWRVLRSGS